MRYDISVIVPVYNAEKYIVRCLNSIMHQDLDSLEIICINDGSTDSSKEILEKYVESNTQSGRNIKIVNQENGGPSKARNTGLKHAAGKYIGFVDCDDCIEANMYSTLIKIAEEEQLNVVMCNINNIYSSGNTCASEVKVAPDVLLDRSAILQIICPTLMREDVFGGPCNRIYKKEFLIDNNMSFPEHIGYGEDAVFQMQVFDKLEKTWFDSGCYYNYIHREGSQSSAKPGRLINTLVPLYEIRKYYGKSWEIEDVLVNNYFIYCAIMDLISSIKDRAYKKKLKYLKYFFSCNNLKEALKTSKISKEQYTAKIYYVYLFLKIVM